MFSKIPQNLLQSFFSLPLIQNIKFLHSFTLSITRRALTDLAPVQSDGGERERGDVQRAVLHEATDVAHRPPEHPGAVHEAHLRGGGGSYQNITK